MPGTEVPLLESRCMRLRPVRMAAYSDVQATTTQVAGSFSLASFRQSVAAAGGAVLPEGPRRMRSLPLQVWRCGRSRRLTRLRAVLSACLGMVSG